VLGIIDLVGMVIPLIPPEECRKVGMVKSKILEIMEVMAWYADRESTLPATHPSPSPPGLVLSAESHPLDCPSHHSHVLAIHPFISNPPSLCRFSPGSFRDISSLSRRNSVSKNILSETSLYR